MQHERISRERRVGIAGCCHLPGLTNAICVNYFWLHDLPKIGIPQYFDCRLTVWRQVWLCDGNEANVLSRQVLQLADANLLARGNPQCKLTKCIDGSAVSNKL